MRFFKKIFSFFKRGTDRHRGMFLATMALSLVPVKADAANQVLQIVSQIKDFLATGKPLTRYIVESFVRDLNLTAPQAAIVAIVTTELLDALSVHTSKTEAQTREFLLGVVDAAESFI